MFRNQKHGLSIAGGYVDSASPFGGHGTLATRLIGVWPLAVDGNATHGGYDFTNTEVTFGAPGGTPPANMHATVANYPTATAKFAQTDLLFGAAGNGASWSLWFRTNISDAGTSRLAGENTGGNPSWIIQFAQAGNTSSGVARAAGLLIATPATVVNDSAWHHFVWTYTTSDKKLRSYLDGAVTVSAATGTQNALDDQGVGVNLGGVTAGQFYGDNTIAQMSENAAWDRSLTAVEVAALFKSGAGLFF